MHARTYLVAGALDAWESSDHSQPGVQLVNEPGACHLNWRVQVDNLVGDAQLKLDGLADGGWISQQVERDTSYVCTAARWVK